jgi:uncharacterized protein (TIGR03086 family)
VPQLNGDQWLLRTAVSYALTGASLAAPPLLAGPTPCAEWDLRTLLDHLSDSMGVLREAMMVAAVASGPSTVADAARSPDDSTAGRHATAGPDPVARLRRQAVTLLTACLTAGAADRLVTIGDRMLTARLVTVTGSLEIAVHGWDIHAACGTGRPVPSRLASVLLPIAPLLIRSDSRDGLFGPPVQLTGPACPGDRLVALLGRRPTATFGRPAGLYE